MLKGEDVVLLLRLSASGPDWTVRTLAEETSIPRSVVHRALKRLAAAGLLDERRRRVNVSQSEEFLIHAVKYVFPAVLEGESRGIPTAWAAEPLVGHIASPPSKLAPVWPDAKGKQRGLALRPLHDAVPDAARRDPKLGERLALVDALRLGDARIRGVAAELLIDRIAELAAARAAALEAR
jgi:DNA-binding FadR family transcriptional regulator